METRKLWRASVLSAVTNESPTYRAEIFRRDPRGTSSILYDGGDYAPYSVESLLDVLRSEAKRPHELLDVSVELKGSYSTLTLRDLARRFAELHEPKLHVRISAPGHPAIIVTPTASLAEPPESDTQTMQRSL